MARVSGKPSARSRVLLEHAVGGGWEKVSETNVDLPELSARARLSARSSQEGAQRYRVTVQPAAGELSTLNNSRTVTVNVEKKALHLLYFTRELGQEFKLLRNELGRDPGLSFSALCRSAGERFTLQGDRAPGDDALAAGFPATLDETRSQPWRLEIYRWKTEEGSSRLMLAGQGYLFRGIGAKDEAVPAVELSGQLWRMHQDGETWTVGE